MNQNIESAELRLIDATYFGTKAEQISAAADLRNAKREAGINCCIFCGTTLHRSWTGTIAATCSDCRK